MTSAASVTASTSGTGTALASASQRRPFASAANAAAYLVRRPRRAPGLAGGGHLGERAPAAGQGEHEVLVAVLGADDARLADGQAGLPGDLARGGRTSRGAAAPGSEPPAGAREAVGSSSRASRRR